MSAALAVIAVGLAAALLAALIGQRRLARRLVVAGQRLSVDVVPMGSGLAEATSVVERVVDRALARGADVSITEARLVQALAVVPQGIVVFEAEGGIVFRNRVAAGYLTGRHSDALVEEAINDLAEQVLQADGSISPTRTVDLFGPPRRTLVLKAIGLERRAEDLGALVVIEDITDRRRLEAIRRDFVANISHELKTPVGALGLLAETLGSEEDPAVTRRLAERMMQESFRVARTIEDLLELSRLEADAQVALEDLLIEPVLAEAIDRVRGAAEQQGISIELDTVAPALRVSGDRRQLVSAVYNLLDNALKYSDDDSTVRVRAHADIRWIDITVADEGIGIPRRDLERVFERFYRVDRARSRDTGGTGLGLAIVRHVAENHAGEVHVDSREGEGSTFTLRLPAATPGSGSARAATG